MSYAEEPLEDLIIDYGHEREQNNKASRAEAREIKDAIIMRFAVLESRLTRCEQTLENAARAIPNLCGDSEADKREAAHLIQDINALLKENK